MIKLNKLLNDIYISDTIYRRELVIIIGFLSDNSECLVTECVINL